MVLSGCIKVNVMVLYEKRGLKLSPPFEGGVAGMIDYVIFTE
jgi:hypothetical protein